MDTISGISPSTATSEIGAAAPTADRTLGKDTFLKLLVDEGVTCFEPEACGRLVAGRDFHKYYFDVARDAAAVPSVASRSTIAEPTFRVMGDCAIVCYVRLVQTGFKTVRTEETRVWRRQAATSDQAQQVCAALRQLLAEVLGDDVAQATRILYGGSVKAANIAGFMREPDVDGALVGGASLQLEEFASIVRFQKHVGT